MATITRRQLVRQTALAAAAAAAPAILHSAPATGPTRIALAGVGGMGTQHLKTLCRRDDVAFTWICEADSKRAAAAVALIRELRGQSPIITADLREVLGDSATQAVFLATPDHWHAPGAIAAAAAGKHVYVEKPCSHNLREGRLMIEAAERNRIVMQVGTQSRSTAHVMDVVQRLRSGVIGEVLAAKAWNSQLRSNHGHKPDSAPPPELDYQQWLGPVPELPFKATYHPAHWRWFRHFGAGDIGNDGVHDIDIARWGLGVERHPDRILAQGSKLFFDDDQEWPDTIYAAFEYDLPGGGTRQLVYEQRDWSPYVQEGHENGCAWYGTEGMIVGGKAKGWQIFGRKNKLIEEIKPPSGPDLAAHHANFLACIRDGSRPAADIRINHLSTSLCHLANIAARTRRALAFDPATEQIRDDEAAAKFLRREYRAHWATPA